MIRILVVTLLAAGATFAASAQTAYDTQLVTTAQEGLVRLGCDVGGVDGKWGKKARAAMNDLREKNGLPPAQSFVGSSLELIHRLSPGPTTLPRPGILIADPTERRAFISVQPNYEPQRALCQGPVGPDGEELTEFLKGKPLAVVTTSSNDDLGYMTRDQDWYTPFMHAVMGSHNACIAGDDASCQAIIDFAGKYAKADALKPGAKRTQRAFDDISWGANSVLRNLVFAYSDARLLVHVDPVEDAVVVDWLKRRIDEYHFLKDSGNDPFSSDYWEAGNHALADMMAAMAFGAMVGDRSMMEPAFANWRESLRVMRDDGSLPSETKRGARALHYSSFQLSQLLAAAEVARVQGIDPAEGSESGDTIPRVLSFLLDAWEEFDKVIPYAKENDGPGPSDDYTTQYINPMHLGWAAAYFARYGNDENFQRLRDLKFDSDACSLGSIKDHKVPDRTCQSGRPTARYLLGLWETTDMPYMGYSAYCLQGVASKDWPLR